MIIFLIIAVILLTMIASIQGLRIYCYRKQRSEFLHTLNNELQVILGIDPFYETQFYIGSKFNKYMDTVALHISVIKAHESMFKDCKL